VAFWKRKEPEELRVPQVRFVVEQDGPPERVLKGKLADFFRDEKCVARAYLVRADLGGRQGITVVLALLAKSGAEKQIVKQVGTIFASVFNSTQHLDIIFLTEDQELDLKESCPAFFAA
jgi:hypothetical protein